MAKITRVTQNIFAGSASSVQVGQIGSLAAGSPTTTKNTALIQSLSNYADGLFSVIVGNNSPAVEDFNGLFYLITSQLAYILQEGIAEYDAGTTYYQYSITQNNGVLYQATGSAALIGSTPTAGSAWAVIASVPNYLVTSSSGIFTTTSTSPVAVTNLTGSISNLGRPVKVFLQADGAGDGELLLSTASGSATFILAELSFTRDGSAIATYPVGVGFSSVPGTLTSVNSPCSGFSFTDFSGTPGTHTYAVTVASGTTAITTAVRNAVLVLQQT